MHRVGIRPSAYARVHETVLERIFVLKKTIKYKDFNGEEVSEDFLFNLSKAELVELEASHEDGLAEAMTRIVDANDNKAIVAEFKKIILLAYGKKSADGKRFIKNQTLRDEFESTEAYSTLFMELLTDTDAAIVFMNGIIPEGLVEDAEKLTQRESKPREVQRLTMKQAEEVPTQELMDKILSGEIVIVDE
jgi:hypothetical protein